jgi:hypothetical protein
MAKREKWNSRAVLWPCKDCGCEVSPVRNGMRVTWSVSDKTWKAAGMKPQGKRTLGTGEFLCFDCLSDRLTARRGRGWEYWGGHTKKMPVSRKTWRRWCAEAHRH